MTSYHVSMLYNTSIWIGCPNNGAQFDTCRPQGGQSKHYLNCRNINTVYSTPCVPAAFLEEGHLDLKCFSNIGQIMYKITKYLKESCILCSD